MNWVYRTVATLFFLITADMPAWGQAPDLANIYGDSAQTRKRLFEADQKLIAGKTADATDDLQRILDEAANDLIAVDGKHFRTAQWIAQQILAKLPPEALKNYQDQIETPARKLLEVAKRTRDPAPLWQLIDRYFVSRSADEGLLLLGDILFERGEFRIAELIWRRLVSGFKLSDQVIVALKNEKVPESVLCKLNPLKDKEFSRDDFEEEIKKLLNADETKQFLSLILNHPLVSIGRADIIYPGSKADPAPVRARIVLAAIFSGDLDRARTELTAFQTKYATAKGTLAGKDGLLATILSEQLKTPPRLPLSANAGTDWPTFGGSPDHSGSIGVRLPVEWGKTPHKFPDEFPGRSWVKELPSVFDSPHPPFGHPVVVNGRVYVTDGQQLCGFDLLTGTQTVRHKLSSRVPAHTPTTKRDEKSPPDPCPSLTVAGGKLYVRTGPPVFRVPALSENGKASESAIICFALKAEVSGGVKELWRIKVPGGDGKTSAMWEGAPLISGRRMWAAYVRFESGRIVHGIVCYDPADADVELNQPVWMTDVCESQMTVANDNRTRQELVTLAGRNVVFCTNTGAVVALDATTGHRAWAFRYPRSGKVDSNRSSDPAPAVAYGGRVFVAPTDADHVYALDPENGRMLWESTPVEGVQIVGVSAGRLIITTVRQVRGIRGLNVANGSDLKPDGWIQEKSTAAPGYGRGFVTDDVVFYPTANGLLVLHTNDGRRYPLTLNNPDGSPGGYFGNIIYADGVLIVVTSKEVWGYLSELKQFGPRVGRSESDPVRLRFNRLTTQAELNLADGKLALARSKLTQVARSDLPPPYRAWAAARLLLLSPKVDVETKLPEDVRGVLTPGIRAEWVIPPDGIPITLENLLLRHLGREPPVLPPAPTRVGMSKLEDIPQLAPDAEIDRTLRLPRGSAPLNLIQGSTTPRRIYLTTSSELHAISLINGDETKHEAVGEFTHVADTPNGFVVAGSSTIALYGSGRAPVWVFRVPITDPLPNQPGEFRMYTDDVVSPPELSAFRLSGSWLVARLGERHLIAFDLITRRIAWIVGTNGESGFSPASFPDAPRFGSEFSLNSRLIAVQLSDGRRWFISTETGRLSDLPGIGEQTARVWWALPPVVVETNKLAVADGPGLIRMLNFTAMPKNPGLIRMLYLVTQRVKWTYFEEKRESSLRGEPPQIRSWGEVLLIAVSRNHGVELDRLSIENGKSKWKRGAAFLDTDRLSLANANIDTDRVYLPVGNSLVAIELKTGETTWEVKLPELHGVSGWVVCAGQKCAIVYPHAAIPREPITDFWNRMIGNLQKTPEMWRLPGLAVGLYDAWVVRSFPILMLDLETGRLLGKIEVPALGPAVTVCFERNVAVVATGDRVCWLK